MSTSLEKLSKAELMLKEVASAEEAVDLINLAEAARQYAQRVHHSTEAANHAQTIKLRAEMKLADIVDAGQENGEIATQSAGRPKSSESEDLPATLEDLGVSAPRLHEARVIRDAFTEEEIVEIAEQKTAEDTDLTRSAILKEARTRKPRPKKPKATKPKGGHAQSQELKEVISLLKDAAKAWNNTSPEAISHTASGKQLQNAYEFLVSYQKTLDAMKTALDQMRSHVD